MEPQLIPIEEGRDYGQRTNDPLDLVFHDDGNSYDSPEDWLCGRNMNSWITEVNRLRALLAKNDIDPATGIDT